jgi:succinate-semialdehyde dehydrogenase / glutarate-semialdehyde dehydrogenase
MTTYSDVSLMIDGAWTKGANGRTIPIVNPATEEVIGQLAHAEKTDLDRALAAADKGFRQWRKVSAYDRYKIMRKAAELIRQRIDEIAVLMTMEQGKPVIEAKGETMLAADIIDWMAEEGRRTYGRIVPARMENVHQLVMKEPIGPVAAFTPWNFPINQVVRKASAALATGCSIIVKGPEDTPGSCAQLIKAFVDAGVPAGVIQLVYGVPSEISEYLIPHPIIKKVTFTGSTPVGKQLAALAGAHMKRVTMELGGHAPAIVFEDADLEQAVNVLGANKFRNAGQVCVAPTRFLVHEKVYPEFVERFTAYAKNVKVGNGLDADTRMGPLVAERRLHAMDSFVSDAIAKGAKIKTGGQRKGNKGYFYEPTVMTDVPLNAKIMNDEPFGPLAPISSFKDFDGVMKEANRLPWGLAAYAYTKNTKTMAQVGAAFESGMVSINHHGLALPEVPFGGIKDSGYGSEGGLEALEAYLNTKFVTTLGM